MSGVMLVVFFVSVVTCLLVDILSFVFVSVLRTFFSWFLFVVSTSMIFPSFGFVLLVKLTDLL